MAKEKPFTDAILLAAGRVGARLFRQNVGRGWVGKAKVTRDGGRTHVEIPDARPLHAGLCTGSSDVIGWIKMEIQPHHVGRVLAVFTAVEVKTGDVATTAEQDAFLARVWIDGGIAMTIREGDPDTAAARLTEKIAAFVQT